MRVEPDCRSDVGYAGAETGNYAGDKDPDDLGTTEPS